MEAGPGHVLWLAEPSKGPLQATLRNLQAAYVNFWQKRAKYPTFKKKGRAPGRSF
nr:hypothetical protein [Candidatus Frankia alpina]